MNPWTQLHDDFLLDATTRNLSVNTVNYYRDCLKVFLEFVTVQKVVSPQDLTSSHLRGYMGLCAESLKPGGVHARMRAVRAFYGFLEREDYLEKNPFDKVKLPKVPQEVQKNVTLEEFKVLSSVALLGLQPLRDTALLSLMFDTGIRASELCGITLEDVLRDKGFILIRAAKGGKQRFVPISRETLKKLNRYILKERLETKVKSLFLTGRNQGLSYESLKSLLKRLFDRAELTYKSPHCFRRGFAVQYVKNAGDVFTLQKILGHATLTMSQRYATLSSQDVLEVHRRASPVSF